MQKPIDADKHNFGRIVKLIERDFHRWFCKPRPIFWEYLFFGKKSPVSDFFSGRGENGGEPLQKYLFNLDTEIESDWTGYSKEIRSLEKIEINSEHFYSFGVLLAYTFAFGIRDLHRSNLVLTESHLQPVDAEVVFTDLVLPNETILLPFKDIEFSQCGLSALGKEANKPSAENMDHLFSGYVDMFATLFRFRENLLLSFESVILNAPIRVIVRNTKIYKKHMSREALVYDFLPEEIKQLERDDIPYFFKRCGDDRVFWISGEDNEISSVQSLANFKSDISRHAQTPRHLLSDPALIEKKMVQGVFFLQKHFGDFKHRDFFWNGKNFRIGPDLCENKFTGHTFKKR